jgi:hypothetical protein
MDRGRAHSVVPLTHALVRRFVRCFSRPSRSGMVRKRFCVVLASFALASCRCGASDYSTPCPSAQQFCVTQVDGGCAVSRLVCCEGNVPSCSGTYAAELPEGCISVVAGDCL